MKSYIFRATDNKHLLTKEDIDILTAVDTFDSQLPSIDPVRSTYSSLAELHQQVEVVISPDIFQIPDVVLNKTVEEVKEIISKIKNELERLSDDSLDDECFTEDDYQCDILEELRRDKGIMREILGGLLRNYEDALQGAEDNAYGGKLKDSDIITITIPSNGLTLGEYVRQNPNDKPKIYLYKNAILQVEPHYPSWLLAQVYVHEMHHLLYDTDRSIPCQNHYISCIEEPLAEFGMLMFIKLFAASSQDKEIRHSFLTLAFRNVQEKRFYPSMCFYGFGAYLFLNIRDKSGCLIPWVELLVKKCKSPMRTPLVQIYEKEWEDFIYPIGREDSVADKLYDALTDNSAIGVPQNPWVSLNLNAKEKVAPYDKLAIDAYIQNNHIANNIVKLDLCPEPYIGNPDANVYLLYGNPKFSVRDIQYMNDPMYLSFMKKNLRHESLAPFDDFVYFNLLVGADGKPHDDNQRWWKNANELRRELGRNPMFFCIEYFPYRSDTFYNIPNLPSNRYTDYLIEKAISQNKIIIILAKTREWMKRIPSLQKYPKVIKLNCPSNPVLSKNNVKNGWNGLIQKL